jgi:hypothetical protein
VCAEVDVNRQDRQEDLRLLSEDAFRAMSQDEWYEAVVERLVARVVRILERATDISRLRHVLQTEVSERVMIHAEMRTLLNPS